MSDYFYFIIAFFLTTSYMFPTFDYMLVNDNEVRWSAWFEYRRHIYTVAQWVEHLCKDYGAQVQFPV